MDFDINMTIRGEIIDADKLSAYKKASGETYKEIKNAGLVENKGLFRQLEKAAAQFEKKTQRETTILDAFSEIGKDLNKGKNVNKYTIVMFNNRAVVCKNCIHDLILRIFGGRREGVNAEIETLLTSKTLSSKTEAFEKRAKDIKYSPDNSNHEIEKGIDYYMGFIKYGVSLDKLVELKDKLSALTFKFYGYYIKEGVEKMDASLSSKLENYYNIDTNN